MRDLTFLFAPAAYWKLPEEERKGRCGPGRGILEQLVPETVYGLCITPACSIHDYMYLVGQTIEDKQEADRVFLNNMIRMIETAGGTRVLIHMRLRRVFLYYESVCHFGGPAFWNTKNRPTEIGIA